MNRGSDNPARPQRLVGAEGEVMNAERRIMNFESSEYFLAPSEYFYLWEVFGRFMVKTFLYLNVMRHQWRHCELEHLEF
jgi:hypothetical protein